MRQVVPGESSCSVERVQAQGRALGRALAERQDWGRELTWRLRELNHQLQASSPYHWTAYR